jgi:retron-type reverse transcriptase
MQKANDIISILREKSKSNKNYLFDRLYRNLFNQDFYLEAYNKIYAKKTKEGSHETDNKTIDKSIFILIDNLIELIKKESYYPRKINSLIPIDDPSFVSDELVQEIIKQILEAIFEPIFLDCSHGFRLNTNCHTALIQIKNNCLRTNWTIAGTIENYFDNINHEMLIKLLSNKITDKRFLSLLKRFLDRGFFQLNTMHNYTFEITQKESLLPLLTNIYLNELDKFITINYEQIEYTRYNTNFLVNIEGNISLAKKINKEITAFITEELKLKLSLKQPLVINFNQNRVRFLDYEILKTRDNIRLLLPYDIVTKMLKPFMKNNKPTYHPTRISLPISKLINKYNSEIISFYNYYSLAYDVSTKIGKFKFYHYYSLAKTIAIKEKSSISKVIKKYGISVPLKQGTGSRKIIGIPNENGTIMTYYNDPLKKTTDSLY